ncbi:MAG: ABC transporter substrate-binding protein [Acidimicrobiales bacterium]
MTTLTAPTPLPVTTRPIAFARPLTARERQIIEDITRREFIIGGTTLAALIAAAGCGDDDNGASGDASATRPVDTPWGTVEIPVSPKRIVATDFPTAQSLLLMGAPVVGFGGSEALLDIPVLDQYVDADIIASLQFVGSARELNLELLATLEPDVIIGQSDFLEEQREPLQEIAPVAVYPATFADGTEDWTQYHRTVGEILGLENEMQEVLDTYDATIRQLRADLGDRTDARVRIAILYTDYAAIYSATSHTGNVLDDLGLEVTLPEELESAPVQINHEISLENIELLDEEHLVVLTSVADADTELAPYRDTALWSGLTAVENDRVLIAEPATWFGGGIGAFQILADVRTLLER